MNKLEEFKQGVKGGIPIGLGYFPVAFTFGMLVVSQGLTAFDAFVICITNLTSAGQFAGLSIISSFGTYLEMILSQLVINSRYFLMSFSLSQKLDNKQPFWYRYFVAYGVTDEIYALSISKAGKLSAFYNLGAMAVAIPGWSLGGLFGGLLGNILPTYLMSALSVSIYGMFIAIFVGPSKHNRNVLFVVIASMVLSLAFTYLPLLNRVSSGFVIIIVTVVVSLLAAKFAPIKESDNA